MLKSEAATTCPSPCIPASQKGLLVAPPDLPLGLFSPLRDPRTLGVAPTRDNFGQFDAGHLQQQATSEDEAEAARDIDVEDVLFQF